jgi:hypothetical protein
MGYEPLLIGVIAFALAALGWSGFQGLRAGRHFRRSLPVDVSHLSLAPPPQVRRVIDQLQRAGFSRLGEDRSARPDLKRQITTWILTDRDGTTAAEVGAPQGAGEAICGFITLFSDGALLVTGHSFGEPHRAKEFVMQAAPARPEDAWQRHQEAQKEMAPRHGGALRLRSISHHPRQADGSSPQARPLDDGWLDRRCPDRVGRDRHHRPCKLQVRHHGGGGRGLAVGPALAGPHRGARSRLADDVVLSLPPHRTWAVPDRPLMCDSWALRARPGVASPAGHSS